MKIGLGRNSQEIADMAHLFTREVSGKRGSRERVIEDDKEIYVHVSNDRASTSVTYDRRTGEYHGTSSTR